MDVPGGRGERRRWGGWVRLSPAVAIGMVWLLYFMWRRGGDEWGCVFLATG